MTTSDREFLTVAEVAGLLQCSEPTVRRRIRTGELPAVQLGGPRSPVRIARHELEAWLTQERPPYLDREGSSEGHGRRHQP